MFYLCLAFTVVSACHLAYLYLIDRQGTTLRRRLDARTASESPPPSRGNAHA
jgi:hypothetical protein